jgi:hypothetical protein
MLHRTVQEMQKDSAHIVALEARLREGVMAKCDHVQLNGPSSHAHRYPGNVNLSFAYVEGESLLMGLRDIAVSSGTPAPGLSVSMPTGVRACSSCNWPVSGQDCCQMAICTLHFGLCCLSPT